MPNGQEDERRKENSVDVPETAQTDDDALTDDLAEDTEEPSPEMPEEDAPEDPEAPEEPPEPDAPEQSERSGFQIGIGKAVDKTVHTIAHAPERVIKSAVHSGVKTAVNKLDPFNKKIDKRNTNDSGVESLRLGNSVVKTGVQGVKTVERTVKTTEKTIKTTGSVIGETVKTSYRIIKKTVVTSAVIIKFTAEAAVNIVAALLNPIVLIVIIFILVLILIGGGVLMIMGSMGVGGNTLRRAYMNAEGLGEVTTAYTEGLGFYQTAIQNAENAFDARIDALYYSDPDKMHSDLIWFQRISPGSPDAISARSELAYDAVKQQVKDTWLPCLTEKEVLAITYVYLQKKMNDRQHTDAELYMVDYTQDILNEVVAALYVVTENVIPRQGCPDRDCAIHQVPNPAYNYCVEQMNKAAAIINGEAPGDVAQARIDYENWADALNYYPPYIDEAYCPLEHNDHAIALTFYDKDAVLIKLGLDGDKYSRWVDMTIAGFESDTTLP